MRWRRPLIVLAMLVATLTADAAAQLQGGPRLDVPYVPTHMRVVAKMLELAKVTKDDVVYDLGSGDGRIVITAAKRFGARGLGVDLDPARVREAKENARDAGVTDRVRFVRGDIFETDLRPATIVTMYLLPAVNLKLRPKLLAELRPGARIVSHNYDLGDWTPLRRETVKIGSTEHVVYGWRVPRRDARPR